MLNPSPVGKALADYLYGVRTSGSEISLSDLEAIWINVMTIIYDDLEATLEVLPGTFQVTVNGVQPGSSSIVAAVTGIGGPAQ